LLRGGAEHPGTGHGAVDGVFAVPHIKDGRD
jgi:hypothetical protein